MSKTQALFYEDLEVGTELPALTKTPTTAQLFMFSAVTRNGHRIHYDQEFAKRDGLPTVLVQGPLQGAQLAAFVTSWMGDGGFLKKFSYSSRGIAMPGQALTMKGRVLKKYEQDGNFAVDLEIWEENEAGDKLVPAEATVFLPSRNG